VLLELIPHRRFLLRSMCLRNLPLFPLHHWTLKQTFQLASDFIMAEAEWGLSHPEPFIIKYNFGMNFNGLS
jgi:hypothetical protein